MLVENQIFKQRKGSWKRKTKGFISLSNNKNNSCEESPAFIIKKLGQA